MKKTLCFLFVFLLLFTISMPAFAEPPTTEVPVPSAILMEVSSGKVLFEKDADKQLPPASVTKVMTILLIAEAIDSGRIALADRVQISENASKMGGSQVFLSPGESMSVQDLLKAIVIASGNDAAMAMAEFISGDSEAFVSLMNKRAGELGMTNTVFLNCHGLDTPGHYTSARDIAKMSAQLLKHEWITTYTTTWMDSLRDGKFTLANTNKLLKSYNGITGLKTGSTSIAKYCLSASAKRDGLELVAVVLGATSSDERFLTAAKLLDFGFANYKSQKIETGAFSPIKVINGEAQFMTPIASPADFKIVSLKDDSGKIEVKVEAAADLMAPVEQGQIVGTLYYRIGEQEIGRANLVSPINIPKKKGADLFMSYLKKILIGK